MSFVSSLRPSLRIANAAQATRAFSTSPAHSLARLTLTGRLGTEPGLQSTASGQEVVKYVVASSYGPRENRQTSWFRVSAFAPEGPQRDFILGLQKGTLVCIEGDARPYSHENEDGQKVSGLNVIQRSIEVLKRPFTENHGSE